MAPRLFITGATGYIGGDAFYAMYKAHPDWNYTALVRNSDRGAVIAKEYPKIRLVYGGLDSSSLIEEECKSADIVLHFADADNEPSARAIAKGLAAHSPAQPGYWIHTSGTGILLFHDLKRQVFGDEHPKIYDDVADIVELTTSLPDDAPHRNIDKIVQAAASDSVKTAIVCPPCIYDRGRGPGNQRSIQVPSLAQDMIEFDQAFYVGEGKTFWSNINVHDLSTAYLALAEAAAEGGGNASWGRNGYYFVENGEHRWGDISRKLGQSLYKIGAIKSPEAVSYTREQASQKHPFGAALWGGNSRSRASRLHKELGWRPTSRSIEASLDDSAALEKNAAGKA